MSKSTDTLLFAPGPSGWELWTCAAGGTPVLSQTTEFSAAGDLADLPGGDVLLLFPARAVTAVPMQVASTDESLFPDLAALHAERLGLRSDPFAGQLTDTFPVASRAESTVLLSVFLKAPGEGELPVRGPRQFDVSARAFPLAGNAIGVWREFGRWVFSIFQEGKLLYFQATGNDAPEPDEALAREIRFALAQIAMQGIDAQPSRAIIWEAGEVAQFAAALRVPVEVQPKPAPVFPEPPSKLLPADVRAARRAAEKKRHLMLGAMALGMLYLGVLGWFGYGLWKTHTETKELTRLAADAAPESERYTGHVAQWDELAPAIELRNNPVDLLLRVASCIPPNSGLRLKNADVSGTEIKLAGEAPTLQAVNSFSLRLNNHNDLAHFQWQTPQPNQSTRGWDFSFTANVPAAQP